jgi:hypothetical protein
MVEREWRSGGKMCERGNTMIRGHGHDGNEQVVEWEHTNERDNAPMNVEWEPSLNVISLTGDG